MTKEHGPRWLKFDATYFANRKILRAGRDGRDVFLAVLCMNAQRGSRGFVPIADWDPEYLAHYLGIAVTEAVTGMKRAVAADLLAVEVDRVDIVGWDEHWSSQAKTRAQIQKDYRERKRGQVEHALPSDVTQLPSSNALPLDRERDRERDAPGARSSLSASPIPEGWKPDTAAVQLAQELGLDASGEAKTFVDDKRSKARKSADWQAEFRNWLRRGAAYQERNGKQKPKPGATKSAPARDVVFGAEQRTAQRESSGDVQEGSDPRKPNKP